jgi:segregation and condensation protein A
MAEQLPSLARPPLNLLLNPETVRAHRPWEIELTTLLELFLRAMAQSGRLDLRVCASAALTSALIYRLKVESLFLLERIRAERGSRLGDPPQVILLPFRYELTSTSLEDLVAVLQRVLEDVTTRTRRVPSPPAVLAEPEAVIEIDPFIANISSMLNTFRMELLPLLDGQPLLRFREYVRGMTLLEEVRTFILLLFLAGEGRVLLEEDNGDLLIRRR